MAFTFFFRDTHTLELAVKYLVPEVTGRSRIRIWDAGSANGPEPYTLAIILSENMGNFLFNNLYINATDIDESGQFGKIINEGFYSSEEIGRIPKIILNKYFCNQGHPDGFYKINDRIKSRIEYYKHDLLSLIPIGSGFSLILCKNVLLHFDYKQRIEVIKMFYTALSPGGLFVTEQTQKMPPEVSHLFTQVVPDAQLFRRVEI